MKEYLLGAGLAVAAIGAAQAADFPRPVYKAPVAAAVAPNGFYFWADGAAEWVRLPSYGLGFHNTSAATTDAGPAQSFDPKATGAGVRGAVGYLAPNGFRFEVGGTFLQADATQIGASGAGPHAASVALNGTPANVDLNCTGGISCAVNSTLSTKYRSWQVNGLVAVDYTYGAFKVMPSFTVFGGDSRNAQSLSQAFTQSLGGAFGYNASTLLKWTDFGGKFGLDASWDINSWLTLGAAGFVGGTFRSTSLSGADSFADPGFPPAALASSIASSATTGAFIGNAELGLASKVMAGTTLRAFVGLNYDNRVPGISAPSFAGPVFTPTGTTPAGIKYESETSYYAGGGLVIAFGR